MDEAQGIAELLDIGIEDAQAAIAHGWDIPTIHKIQGFLKTINKTLGVAVECEFGIQEPPTEDKLRVASPSSNRGLGILNGRIFLTPALAVTVIKTPSLLWHEAGHELERKHHPQAAARTETLEELEAFSTPGFPDPKGRHSCPPFGATLHHACDLLRVFSGPDLESEIGYGARQIYADTVLLKELILHQDAGETVPGFQIEGVLQEWIRVLDNEYADHATEIECGRHKWLLEIPNLARLAATAWSLRDIARVWVEDQREADQIGEHFASFFGRFGKLLADPIGARGAELSEDEARRLLETPRLRSSYILPEDRPAKSGLCRDEILAVAVLTRAYKEHFINSMSRADLFTNERLEPHFERLRSSDEYVRRREASTLGEIGSVRVIDGLMARIEDDVEELSVKREAFTSLCAILTKNSTAPAVLPVVPRLVEMCGSPDGHTHLDQGKLALALMGVGEQRPARIIEALCPWLESKDPQMQFAAVEIIEVIATSSKDECLRALEVLAGVSSRPGRDLLEKLIEVVRDAKHWRESRKDDPQRAAWLKDVEDYAGDSLLLQPQLLKQHFAETTEFIWNHIGGSDCDLLARWVVHLQSDDVRLRGAALARILTYAKPSQVKRLAEDTGLDLPFDVKAALRQFVEGIVEASMGHLGEYKRSTDAFPDKEIGKEVFESFARQGIDIVAAGPVNVILDAMSPGQTRGKIVGYEKLWIEWQRLLGRNLSSRGSA